MDKQNIKASKEADAGAQIRPFQTSDLKEVRLLLGWAAMEQLAVANQLCYWHPLFGAAWVLASALFVQYMQWWPKNDQLFTWLRPLPAVAAVAVPFLFGVDWINRPYFERKLKHVLSREDVLNIPGYYSQAPGSGFFVLSYKNTPIGLVAIDTAHPSKDLLDAEQLAAKTQKGDDEKKETERKGKGKEKEVAPTTARIRHFHVDAPYRKTGIASDLLAHALRFAFALPSIQNVYFQTSPLSRENAAVCAGMGFGRSKGPEGARELGRERMGLGRWRSGWVEIGREGWERRAGEFS